MQVFVHWAITDTIKFDLTVNMFDQYGPAGNTRLIAICSVTVGVERAGQHTCLLCFPFMQLRTENMPATINHARSYVS